MKKILTGISVILLLLITAWVINVWSADSPQIITIERTIEIEAPQEDVFNYFSDLSNDPVWRAEVDVMEIIHSPEFGSWSIEYSSFGDKNTITTTYVTEQTDNKIVYTTPDSEPYFLESRRIVEDLGNGISKVIYILEYDNNMTQEISPVRIPKFLTKLWYWNTMATYLKVLKEELE